MSKRTGTSAFFSTLTRGSERLSPALQAIFFAGLLGITLLGNWLYDALARLAGWLPLVLTALLIVLALILWQVFWQGIRVQSLMHEQHSISQYPGLIWILSKGSSEAPLTVIKHHASRLQHLWVILTAEDAVLQNAYAELETEIRQEGWTFGLIPVEIAKPDARSTRAAVEDIFTRRAPAAGLEADSVVADITGGTKPMTAGMVLACSENNWPMEYLASDTGPDGKIVKGSSRIVSFDITPIAGGSSRKEASEA